MSAGDMRLMRDVANITPCYRQLSEGWYKNSCFEEGWGVRRCCINCRVLKRLEKRLAAGGSPE